MDVVLSAFTRNVKTATRIDETFAALSIELHRTGIRRPDSNRQPAGYEPCSSICIRCEKLADRAGFEPATSGLTDRHSGHLSYPSMKINGDKVEKTCYVLYETELRSEHSERPDSNRRPRPLKGCSPFSIRRENDWSRRRDSNPQPRVYETRALPLSYVARNWSAG